MIGTIDLEDGLGTLAVAGVELPPHAHGKLAAFLALLGKWNRTYNLTSIRDPGEMITHHALDALAVLPHLPREDDRRVLDIGSGGGVPGFRSRLPGPRGASC